jgi:hypothetical protein
LSEKINLTTVQLLAFGRTNKGGWAKFSSGINSRLIEAMEWAEIPECTTSAKMAGELDATVVCLTPKDEAMKRHTFDLDCNRVSDFEIVRRELEGKKQKGFRQELHFKVRFADPTGCKKLEPYYLTVGKSSMLISYTRQPKQEDLPGTEPMKDTRQQELPN